MALTSLAPKLVTDSEKDVIQITWAWVENFTSSFSKSVITLGAQEVNPIGTFPDGHHGHRKKNHPYNSHSHSSQNDIVVHTVCIG